MGAGIAQLFAQHAHDVSLVDVDPKTLQQAEAASAQSLSRFVKKERCTENEKKSALARITYGTNLQPVVATAGIVIEAATEQLALKKDLFRQVDEAAPASCLLATNTSSLSITQIATATKRPEQVIGMHFMNPVPLMPLVEIICGYATSETTATRIVSLARSLKKTPIQAQDYPGFVSNRILLPMINEAIYALHEGVAGVEAIDKIMQLGMAHPMGPLRLADFIGLDVCLNILKVLHQGFGLPKYAPCPRLVNMVEAGYLGAKVGEGFYLYTDGKAVAVSPHVHMT